MWRAVRSWPCWLALWALAVGGCANCQLPRIDPTGRHIFAPPAAPKPPVISFKPQPGKLQHHHKSGVRLTPTTVIAPVGAEVVMTASVCGQREVLVANERVEWQLAPGSVGQFIGIGDRRNFDWLFGAEKPEKITNTYAVGVTSSRYLRLTRGTPTVTDDVSVLKGQAWVTVSSPIEGSSYVTAYAPNAYGWDTRQQTAAIHWVDAKWTFPPPAVNPAGTQHTFTTTVTRHSNDTPIPGYHVRYEIISGPPAGFAPDGNPAIEVVTDGLGQGRAEIVQTQPAAGTNVVRVEIIRPAELSRDGTRISLGSGTTQKTWSSPTIAIKKTGPAQAAVGALVSYRIDVSNGGSVTSKEIVVTDALVDGLTLVNSDPAATPNGPALEWRLGDLAAGEVRSINVTYRAVKQGTLNNCVTVRTAEGLSAQDCVATTVMVPAIDVTVAGPDQATVGQEVTFVATITNRGGAPATGLTVIDRFDPGLQHASAASPIERSLEDLLPGQSRQVTVPLRVIAPGQQCNTIEVVGQLGERGSGQKCLMALPAGGANVPPVGPVPPGGPGGAVPPGGTSPPQGQPPAGQPPANPVVKPTLTIKKTGPARRQVGDVADFTIDISNTGTVAASNLTLTDNYDASLDPVRATDKFAFAGNDLIWRVDELKPGQTIRFEVKCRCQAPAAKACNRATVTSAEGARADDEACVEVVAPATPLTISVRESHDPIQAGNEATYDVLVTNAGPAADQNVQLAVTVTPQLALVATGTTGPTAGTIAGPSVRFAVLPSIRAGETLTYRVQVRAAAAGAARFRVEATSANTPNAVVVEETTTVF